MKIESATKQRIIKNALLSLFIYILPVLLMFLTFYFTQVSGRGKSSS